VTGDPASRFSMVTVRTGRTCGAAASDSGRHPTRSADNANVDQMVRVIMTTVKRERRKTLI
jgi:hypothetical protein